MDKFDGFSSLKEKEEFDKECQVPPSFNCTIECFNSIFEENSLPLNDHLVNVFFPVPKGTLYSRKNCELIPEWIPILGRMAKEDIWYDKKISLLLSLTLTNDIFTEHSLFLMKEHLKTFSPYSDKAKELLKKLEELE